MLSTPFRAALPPMALAPSAPTKASAKKMSIMPIAGSPVTAAPVRWWPIWIMSSRPAGIATAPSPPAPIDQQGAKMKSVRHTAVACLALAAMATPVLAAPICATQQDMAAFRTAAVQQQLMVAALTCHDIDAYNRFVLAYRPELQKSDAELKSFFIRKGSEAEYDTFKTKLANLSSLSDIANGPAYCANAGAAFDIALRSRQSLDSFVADQRLMIALPKETMCQGKPVEASVPARTRVAKAEPATVD